VCFVAGVGPRRACSIFSGRRGGPTHMTTYIEVWRPDGVDLVPLELLELTIGRAESNNVCLPHDTRVSRLHAALRPLGDGWSIRDVGSRNGTFVNNERIDQERALRAGDEILIGHARLVFRADRVESDALLTMGAERAPDLTPRERDVLLALFRPALDVEVFTEPASTREIAAALSVSEAAVKQHLAHLYDKFGLVDDDSRRRVRLANEALRRGAVTMAEVRQSAR
jgi:FHA domain/Sigma-70, region 4